MVSVSGDMDHNIVSTIMNIYSRMFQEARNCEAITAALDFEKPKAVSYEISLRSEKGKNGA